MESIFKQLDQEISTFLFLMKKTGAALDKGLRQYSHDKICTFMKNGNIVAVGERKETSQCLEDFFKKTDKHLEKGIKIFRSDNDLEFINKEIEELTHNNIALRIRKQYHLLRNRMVALNEKTVL
ncbi:uncharacterized protein LOC102677909 [Apis dorsata]|uniref:uncharacterized protein LOC102677909 n=1 Tax=Apis dorsata TaxID=7462 RepID=UPI0012938A17|nr:uncharacterized protein LOC102677909 [Apis dorsata]